MPHGHRSACFSPELDARVAAEARLVGGRSPTLLQKVEDQQRQDRSLVVARGKQLVDAITPVGRVEIQWYGHVLLATIAAPHLPDAVDRVPSSEPAPAADQLRAPQQDPPVDEPPEHLSSRAPSPHTVEVIERLRSALGGREFPPFSPPSAQLLERFVNLTAGDDLEVAQSAEEGGLTE